MRTRDRNACCTCVVCGCRFTAYCTTAMTCTEACRKQLSRRRQKAAQYASLHIGASGNDLAIARAGASAVRRTEPPPGFLYASAQTIPALSRTLNHRLANAQNNNHRKSELVVDG